MRRFRESEPNLPTGWMIGVMVQIGDSPTPVRHFYAVAQDDRARAEWAAVDLAVSLGAVASSPVKGVEPVEAVGPLSGAMLKSAGMGPGEVRALGWKWPRRWLAA